MRRALGLLSVALVSTLGCRRGAPVTPSDCERLLDRYADALLHVDGEKPSHDEVLRVQADARRRAAESPAFARCPRDISRAAMDCALEAWGVDAIERCLVPVR